MRKILLAIDGSACSSRAVAYCGKQFAGVPDLSVALLHVLPNLPAQFWDDGHILSEQEKEARETGRSHVAGEPEAGSGAYVPGCNGGAGAKRYTSETNRKKNHL